MHPILNLACTKSDRRILFFEFPARYSAMFISMPSPATSWNSALKSFGDIKPVDRFTRKLNWL